LDSRFATTEAVVLNSIRFGEGHKIINLFTERFGRIEASAFGARKTKSRFGSRLEPFTISQLVLYRKNEDSPFSISEADIRFQDSSFSEEYEKYIIASALIESVVLFVAAGQIEAGLYRLLSESLRVLSSIPTNKCKYLLSMYDVQFLMHMGYTPNTSLCKKCGREMGESEASIDHFFGFPLCSKCAGDGSFTVLGGALRFIRWACEQPVFVSKKVKMEKTTLRNLRSVIELLYMHTFHRKPQSWKQLNALL